MPGMSNRLLIVAALLLGLAPMAWADDAIVFAYFLKNSDNIHKGRGSIYITYSPDGKEFRHLNPDARGEAQPVLTMPEQPAGKLFLTRDPSLVLGPDGLFHMVWTSGWDGKTVGYAASRDLLNWSEPQLIPVWGEADQVANTWAPEIHYDAEQKCYVILFASTDRARFPKDAGGPSRSESNYEHRLYRVTTTDFESLTRPQRLDEFDFNCIDAQIAFDAQRKRYVMVLKDERLFSGDQRDPQKNLRLAFAEKMQGPYAGLTEAIAGPHSEKAAAEGAATYAGWCEGPCLVRFGGKWMLYLDPYTTKGQPWYGLQVSDDLVKWMDVSAELKFPKGERPRHGTVLVVARERLPLGNK